MSESSFYEHPIYGLLPKGHVTKVGLLMKVQELQDNHTLGTQAGEKTKGLIEGSFYNIADVLKNGGVVRASGGFLKGFDHLNAPADFQDKIRQQKLIRATRAFVRDKLKLSLDFGDFGLPPNHETVFLIRPGFTEDLVTEKRSHGGVLLYYRSSEGEKKILSPLERAFTKHVNRLASLFGISDLAIKAKTIARCAIIEAASSYETAK